MAICIKLINSFSPALYMGFEMAYIISIYLKEKKNTTKLRVRGRKNSEHKACMVAIGEAAQAGKKKFSYVVVITRI